MTREIVYLKTQHHIESHEVEWEDIRASRMTGYDTYCRFPYQAHAAPGYCLIRQSDDSEWTIDSMQVCYQTRALWCRLKPCEKARPEGKAP
jgi:hypothetical protein